MKFNKDYIKMIDSLKHFKAIKNNGYIFAIIILIAEISIFTLTVNDFLKHSISMYIMLICIYTALSIDICIIAGGILHELDNENPLIYKQEVRQAHLNIIKRKSNYYPGYIIYFLNSVFGFASIMEYAVYCNALWTWILSVFMLLYYAIWFYIQRYMLSNISKSIIYTQQNINSYK